MFRQVSPEQLQLMVCAPCLGRYFAIFPFTQQQLH